MILLGLANTEECCIKRIASCIVNESINTSFLGLLHVLATWPRKGNEYHIAVQNMAMNITVFNNTNC